MAAKKKRSSSTGRTRSAEVNSDIGSKPVQRWSQERKVEVVLRLLRGESVDAVSRDVGVESYRLEQWKQQALASIKGGLQTRRTQDPLQQQLDAALKRVGELTMDNELLQIRCKRSGVSPFVRRRSKP